jgi:hypothetical protein
MKRAFRPFGARGARVLSLLGIALLAVVATGAYLIFDRTPEGPDQPIAFYHSVHAGDNQIACMYCHYTADRSASAGIPPVSVCVGCHIAGATAIPPEQVQQLTFPVPGQGPERPDWWYEEANKLLGYWQRQEAIPWVKVYDLPDHVRFSHQMHVNTGVQCQSCHGPVEEMDKVYQFSSLHMGWCIDCHRGTMPLTPEEDAAIAERSSFRRKLAALQEAGSDLRGHQAIWPNQRASIDCFVCHY